MLALLAVLALSLGPQQPVSAPVPGPNALAGFTDVGSNGEVMLAVWIDGRSRNSLQVIATRVDANGTVLDPNGIVVFDEALFGTARPYVTWNGSHFIVAWAATSSRTLLAAIDADGNVTRGFVDGVRAQGLAQNGGSTMMLAAAEGPYRIVTGLVGDDLSWSPATTLGALPEPSIAPLGDGFVVLWGESATALGFGEVRAQRFGANAQPLAGPATLPLGTFNSIPFLAVDGDRNDDVIIAAGDLTKLTVARLHPDGSTTDVKTIEQELYPTGVVVHDAGFDVLAQSNTTAVALRFTEDGTLAHDAWYPTLEAHTTSGGRGASVHGEAFATWTIGTNVFGTFPFRDDAPLTLLSPAPAAQLMPSVATRGRASAIAWQESRPGTQNTFRVMLRRDDGEPVAIANTEDDRLSPPAITFAGDDVYVAYKLDLVSSMQLYHRLFVRRIGADATLISTTAHDQYAPALASDGTNVLAAWCEGAWFQAPKVRLTLLGTNETFDMPDGLGTPSIVFDGTRYFVIARNDHDDVIGMFVDRAGVAGSPFVVAEGAQSAPSIAWDGEQFLVVYDGGLNAMAQYVSGSGARLGSPIALGFTATPPRVTADRAGFVVAYDGKIARIDGEAITLSESDSNMALAPGMVVYTRVQGVPRVFSRVIGYGRTRLGVRRP